MRIATSLLIVALFGVISANKALFQELSEINKHPFGATMLAAISTNLRAKTPVSEVQDLLQSIYSDLTADSSNVDSTYAANRDYLTTSIEGQKSSIENFQEAIANLEENLVACEQEGEQKTADRDEAAQSLDDAKTSLANKEEEHTNANTEFDADVASLNDAIAACNQALDRMKTYQSATGASLIQVASSAKAHLKSFSSMMNKMAHKLSKHGNMYAPLIHELVQLTQDVEESKSSQVVGLLNQLLGLLQDALAARISEQAAYNNDYETFKASAEADIEAYEGRIQDDQRRIEELGAQSIQASVNLAANNQNLIDAQTSLESLEAENEKNNAVYQANRNTYDKLIAILERLIQHFNDNVAAVNEWTANQLNGEN